MIRRPGYLLALVFLVVLVWYSIPLVELALYVSIGALDLPEAVYRVPATVGGVLMILFVLLRVALRWRRAGATTGDAGDDTVM